MKNNFIKIKILLFILFVSISSFAQETYLLKYNFLPGKSVRYLSTLYGNVTESLMGQELKILMDGNFNMKLETEKIFDDKFSILISLDSGKVHTSMPMKDTTINLKDFANKRIRLLVAQSGKVLNKEMVDSINSGLEMLSGIGSGMIKLFVLPEKDIKKGESWNYDDIDSVNMMGGNITTKSNITCTLAGIIDTLDHQCLKIAFTGKTSSEGKAKIMGMELFIEGNGKLSGVIYFDAVKGVLVFTNSILNNEMTMAATGEQNIIIPISQTLNTTQTLISK